MTKQEVSFRDILFGLLNFFRNQRKIIILSLLFGIIVSIFYHNTRKPFFESSAIAISGLYFYENYENHDFLDPLLAIEMINYLSEDIQQKNVNDLSRLLNLTIPVVEKIKSLSAVGLYRIDADNRKNPINKFEIKLRVFDSSIIEMVEEALLHYFSNNQYVKSHYESFKKRNEFIIEKIDEEIISLQNARKNTNVHNTDFSSISITNSRMKTIQQNQIVDLYRQKQDYIKEYDLLKPLSFVKRFSIPEKTENLLLLRILIITFGSLILGLVIAVFNDLTRDR